MLPNEIDTNQGQIVGTKHIKNFTTIDNLNENQYILAVNDDDIGVGLKLSPRALSKTVISPMQGNGLIQDDDGLLYSNSAINKYDETITYSKGDWVLSSIVGIDKFYKSLQGDNVGNDLSDTDYWQPISFGGGSSSSGLEIGDIGTTLFVDETQGKRRRLNGSILDINDNTRGFVNWLKAIVATTPSLATTEQNWQAEVTTSVYGQCGKFVIDEENATVRLPKVINIQGLSDLASIGVRFAQNVKLPNITGDFTFTEIGGSKTASGAFTTSSDGTAPYAGGGGLAGTARKNFFNASRSSSVYSGNGTDTKIQPEAIQYPYFIQIATGAETEINIVNDIELNNPFSLFDSKYSDHKLFNASWLRSQGQYNSKAVYVKAYEALQVEQNTSITVGSTVTLPSGTQYTKQGLSVKLSTGTYTDYDFVLNTSDETFRLPLLDGSESIIGTDKYIDYSNPLTENPWRIAPANGIVAFEADTGAVDNALGIDVTKQGYYDYGYRWQANTPAANQKITIPVTKGSQFRAYFATISEFVTYRFYYNKGNGSLYYYVGETIQNANLIDAGRIMETYATKEFATNASFPSNRYIDLTLGASETTYIAPSNGYYYLNKTSTASGQAFKFAKTDDGVNFGNKFIASLSAQPIEGISYFVKRGEVVKLWYTLGGTTNRFRFYYAEGAN